MGRESLLPSGAPSCKQSCVPPFCSTGPPCWVLVGGSTWRPGRRRFSAALCTGCGGTGSELCSRSLDHYALDTGAHRLSQLELISWWWFLSCSEGTIDRPSIHLFKVNTSPRAVKAGYINLCADDWCVAVKGQSLKNM